MSSPALVFDRTIAANILFVIPSEVEESLALEGKVWTADCSPA
jgi:hypothetical protein